MLQLGVLGVKINESDDVCRFFSVIPKFSQMACSIETLLYLDTLSTEELIDRLKVAKECHEQEELEAKHIGKLLLSREEWLAWMSVQIYGRTSSSQVGRIGGKVVRPRARQRQL
jgi:hypothetical protein